MDGSEPDTKYICNIDDCSIDIGAINTYVEKNIKSPKENKTTKKVTPVKDIEIADCIQFIIDTIGFNREAINSFLEKLTILKIVNPEAWESIYIRFIEIIRDAKDIKDAKELDSENVAILHDRLQTLKVELGKNHGTEIRKYRQKMKDAEEA